MEENSNKNAVIASTQRDLIAGEVSKDLTNRMLLPEKITKAHNEGIIYFHNPEYFLQPMFNSCLVNIKDMLKNGTFIKPSINRKNLQTADMILPMPVDLRLQRNGRECAHFYRAQIWWVQEFQEALTRVPLCLSMQTCNRLLLDWQWLL